MLFDIDFSDYRKGYQTIPDSIDNIENLEYSEFFKTHLVNNVPCMVHNITEDWKCAKDWVDKIYPHYDNLDHFFGSQYVPITECDYESKEHCKREMIFKDFINYWKKDPGSDPTRSISYLKDWHLRRNQPNNKFYTVPKYFASDWLNEYSIDNDLDDYMFVYMGPKGSWTPFHADVYSSFSWSANVVGKKRWLLLPPGEERKLADTLGNLPEDITGRLDNVKYYDIIQNSGDAVFVPSGWFHQVHNLENTISINHNWVNGCNIDVMWKALKFSLSSVEKEIIEFKETSGWREHCQVMLRALFGIDYENFFKFIKHIAVKRLNKIKENTHIEFDTWILGNNHVLFDLGSIRSLIKNINEEVLFDENDKHDLGDIVHNIDKVL